MLLETRLFKEAITKRQEEVLVGEGVRFKRYRRITGYLVGTLERFNNAKLAEVHDRVKHN